MAQRSSAFILGAGLIVAGLVTMTAQTPQPGAPGQRGRGAAAGAAAQGFRGRGRGGPITLHAARVIDGRGQVITDGVITVQGTKITAVGPRTPDMTSFTYDFPTGTLMPGMIDVHVHPNWYFGPDGHYGERNIPVMYAEDAELANMRAMLEAGFTTVQSVGAASDKPLREAVAAGIVPGPRLLSSLDQIVPRYDAANPDDPQRNDTPDALRARVQRDKENGADLIKLFASASIRDGGKMNVSQAQIDAVCGEAKTLGLRSLVHAHSPESIMAAVKGGCTEIEHGLFADDAAIAAMKAANVYFDPNIGLVLQNYLENKYKFMGSGNFTPEGFAAMESALPNLAVVFRKALAAGLRMPMGTDAVAGAFGQNAREIVARAAAGQSPMDAITGATSLSAESLNLGDTIGTIAPGYEADIVAVPADPVADISALRFVEFVMKGGRVYKNP